MEHQALPRIGGLSKAVPTREGHRILCQKCSSRGQIPCYSSIFSLLSMAREHPVTNNFTIYTSWDSTCISLIDNINDVQFIMFQIITIVNLAPKGKMSKQQSLQWGTSRHNNHVWKEQTSWMTGFPLPKTSDGWKKVRKTSIQPQMIEITKRNLVIGGGGNLWSDSHIIQHSIEVTKQLADCEKPSGCVCGSDAWPHLETTSQS